MSRGVVTKAPPPSFARGMTLEEDTTSMKKSIAT
ncbi:hypothetical protein HGI09_16280 [Streptomyces collinus]|nr:hypothetical protein HGI10_47840 [Streptomyces collinus]UJA14323.1 hypothetical protein HGI09_16280 [Streptomyces collinus]